MHEMDKKRNRLRQEAIIKSLALRNIEGFFAETKEEALKIITKSMESYKKHLFELTAK